MWRAIRDAVQEHSLDYGESFRVRHNDCEHRANGQTLDIRRVEDGYVGYCFRCDSGGMYSSTSESYKKPKGRKGGLIARKYQKSERTSDLTKCPVQVKLWLSKSCIPRSTLCSEGVKWNSTLSRLEFPVQGHTQTVNRNYGLDSSGSVLPKYTSRVPYQLRMLEGGRDRGKMSTLVVVEDWLSCLQCYLAGYSSLALFTTSIKQEALVLVAKQAYTKIIVALDHDNVTVIANERKLMRQFRLFHDNVVGLELRKDPKAYEIHELQEILG